MPLIEATPGEEKHLQDIADTIASSHKVLIVTGAGISTSIGIPDFRSKDGLYNLIPEQTLPSPPPSEPSTPSKQRFTSPASTPSRKRKAEVFEEDNEPPSSQSSTSSRQSSTTPSKRLKGQDLFDSRIFNSAEGTTTFYRFIASLREKIHEDVTETSKTHQFIRVLRDGGRLMRCYTQNIDGLEAREGLVMDLKRGKGTKRRFMKKNWEEPREQKTEGTDHDGGCEVVQLHGDLETLRCSVCSTQWTWTENETEIFMDGFAPRCKKCARKSDDRQATGKRGLPVGTLRPNIVLYGEDHPQNSLLSPFVPFDASSQPDVLIIMGTSLKVFGLQKIIREFAKAVHAQKNGKVIFVNRTKPAESVWDNFIDYFVPMDCDDWVANLKSRRPDVWLRQGALELKAIKKPSTKRKRSSEEGNVEKDVRPAKKQENLLIEIPPKPTARSPAPSKKATVTTAVSGRINEPSTPSKAPRSIAKTSSLRTPTRSFNAENLRQTVLSPLAQSKRPAASPNSTPPSLKADSARTPATPTWSPITPRSARSSALRRELKLYDDEDLKIQESDHEKENKVYHAPIEPEDESEVMVSTPSKPATAQRILLPLVLKHTVQSTDERDITTITSSKSTATGRMYLPLVLQSSLSPLKTRSGLKWAGAGSALETTGTAVKGAFTAIGSVINGRS